MAAAAGLLPVALLWLAACGPSSAADELQGGVLFYEWPHGSTLTDQPERVAAAREEKVRALQELEDFTGGLRDWRLRTGPVERLQIGPDDFVLDDQIFFYFLASLRRPAVSPKLTVQILRRGPDGEETLDHEERRTSRMNRRVHSGGLLYSMRGLAAGEHRLRVELRDGDTVAAGADLTIDYHPGGLGEAPEGASPSPPTSR